MTMGTALDVSPPAARPGCLPALEASSSAGVVGVLVVGAGVAMAVLGLLLGALVGGGTLTVGDTVPAVVGLVVGDADGLAVPQGT